MWTGDLLSSIVFHEAVHLLQLLQVEPDAQSPASGALQAISGNIFKFERQI